MNRLGVGFSCAVVFSLVACASEEVDPASFLGNAGRGAAVGGHSGALGRGGSSASSTAGSAGRASQSGTAGSVAGASFNGAGGMSVAGAFGGGSSIGSGGLSGAMGNAGSGSGGASPVFESGTCASSPSMSLSYQQQSNNSKQISARYQFINTTDTPIPLAQLKIRYFFSDEETSGWSAAIYDAKLEGGTGGYRPLAGSVLAVSPLGATVAGADSYLELSFSSTASIEKGAIATVNWDLQPHSYNAPDQVQTNDYSYNAAAVAYTVWDHVVIYQSANLVWGCTPKAAGGGSGGASGAGTGGNANGGSSGAADGGSGGTVNGGATSAGATAGGASGAGVGGASGVGGTAGAAGASGGGAGDAAVGGSLGVSGASGSSGVGGDLNAGAGAGAGGSTSSGGISGAP